MIDKAPKISFSKIRIFHLTIFNRCFIKFASALTGFCMEKLNTQNSGALRYLMTEDLYLLNDKSPIAKAMPVPDSVPTIDIPKETPSSSGYNYLGENNRYFLILIQDENSPGMDGGHQEMLLKIMKAKGMEMRDLAILNLAKYPDASFIRLKEFFSCNKLLMFGINPTRIGLPPFGSNKSLVHENVKVLASFGLDEMSKSVDKKKEFWAVMKDF